MFSLRSSAVGVAGILSLNVIDSMTEKIVDSLPRRFSLMQCIPQVIVTMGDRLYKPYLSTERQLNFSCFISKKVAGPLYEEYLYRYAIQKLLLKELPKKIFGKNEKAIQLLDSNTAKIVRTLVTSYLFATLHYSAPRDNNPKLYELGNVSFVSTFFGGMVMGLQMELTNNLIHPLLTHCAFNILYGRECPIPEESNIIQ